MTRTKIECQGFKMWPCAAGAPERYCVFNRRVTPGRPIAKQDA